jgi:Flp pilus assembly protein TadG
MRNLLCSRSLRKRGEKGHAVIEVALLAPWIFLLFAAVFDFGFYMYAAISVQNAARVAALRLSESTAAAGSTALAQTYACAELSMLLNVGSNCPNSSVTITPTIVTGPDGASAVQVAINYTTVQLFPLPFLTGQWTFQRIAEARIT